MFKKILVPLDGSVESETVLPYVRDIASRFDSAVDILSVGIGSKRRRINQLLDDYIRHALEHLQNSGITCRAALLYSSPAEEMADYAATGSHDSKNGSRGKTLYGGPADYILEYIRKNHPNLVIMATHGHSGLRRWWLGSVFERVVSQSTTSVLGIHSKQIKEIDKDKIVTFKHILAPLDGSAAGEAALNDTEAIALKTGASITILHVIPEPHSIEARILGPEFKHFVKSMQDAGLKYLNKLSDRITEKGIDVTIRVVTGDPAESIVDVARHEKADLIAMSTRGRSGIARLVMGSVADKILHESKIPMWLVKPKQVVSQMLKNDDGRVS